MTKVAPFLPLLLVCAAPAAACLTASADARCHVLPSTPGSLVSVAVEIDGETAPLYLAPDGSGRFYLEAREGRPYALVLANRSTGRVGVVLAVDGLNVISGERETGHGRMYVLGPWQWITVRGWRTSLQEVRRFTFVDERRSYAARSGKANRKMGWIEVTVYRERDENLVRLTPWDQSGRPRPLDAPGEGTAGAPGRGKGVQSFGPAEAARAYPGTGWGDRSHDPAALVAFDAEPRPAQTVALRYEYRPALVSLGVLPGGRPLNRLRERDGAESGFVEPPLW